MESPRKTVEHRTFNTPEEELQYLRARTEEMENSLGQERNSFEKKRIIKRQVQEYAQTPQKQVLPEENHTTEQETVAHALGLKEEEHDTQIDELVGIAMNQSLHKSLGVAAKMGAHIEDDFHKVITQYIMEGVNVKGMWFKNTQIWRATHMALYEVSIPASRDENDQSKELEKLIAAMEQFYSGMLSIASGKKNKNIFTVEMAVAEGTEEVIFYVSVPHNRKELFERHLLSIYSDARIEEKRDDYNIFTSDGESAASVATLGNHASLPLKSYKEFEHDPLNVILSAFSKLKKHGEGAAIQFVIGDDGTTHNKRYKKIIDKLRKGTGLKESIARVDTWWGNTWYDTKKAFKKGSGGGGGDPADQLFMDEIGKKIASRIVPTNVRIIASAVDQVRAEDIVDTISSTFNQFEAGQGNYFNFKKVKKGALRKLINNFIFRTFNQESSLLLSIEELTTICHLTASAVSTSRELKKSESKEAPAPVDLSEEGIFLGINNYGGTKTPIRFAPTDRLRHYYEIGQTGTGKSYHIRNMIIQDMYNGDGVCYIDPHGSDIMDILAAVPPEREDDVIYFDPGYIDMPMSLNMLEYDITHPEQKTMVVDEMLGIFKALYSDTPESMGPQFEQYFRNAVLAVIEDPATGSTVIDLVRVLADEEFRNMKLSRCSNPLVVQFWKKIADQTSGEYGFQNMIPYITNKFDIFLTNEIMRPIVAQEKSSFNFREVMDSKKILLVNLSKGRLGDLNSNFLGLIIISKILIAALSRVDAEEKDRHPFYLYIDEFQNFMTPSINTILAEARKYKLSLNMAHQFLGQLDDNIKSAVFGNVGTKFAFRIGAEDTEFMAKQFTPEFTEKDLLNLRNFNAYVAPLINGKPAKPFSIETMSKDVLKDLTGINLDNSTPERLEQMKQMSYKKYGRPRAEVEAEVHAKYQQLQEAEKKDEKKDDPFAGF